MTRFRLSPLFVLVLQLLFGAMGRQPYAAPALAQTPAPVESLAITHLSATAETDGQVRVSALVSALDAEKKPVSGLGPEDFTLSENGQTVESEVVVAPADIPLIVTLLVDTSATMAQPDPQAIRAIDRAKDGLAVFVDEALEDGDLVSVYEYNLSLTPVQALTPDHNLAIDQGVFDLDAHEAPEACLHEALLETVELLSVSTPGLPVIIVVTGNADGGAEGGCNGATAADVVEAVARAGVSIYTVGFGRNIDQENLALLSSNQSLLADDAGGIGEQLSLILAQLQGQYELSYATQAASGPARITVVENGSQKSDNGQVLVPQAIELTPTPLPEFMIELAAEPLDQNKLRINVTAPDDVTLKSLELFVNESAEPVQVDILPPFDGFELDTLDLGEGKHAVTVKATAQDGRVASPVYLPVEVEFAPTSTPVPTATPQPAPTPTPASASLLEDNGVMTPIILIAIGGLLFIVVIGLLVYAFLVLRRNKKAQQMPSPPPVHMPVIPHVPAMITHDAGDESDIEKTYDPGEVEVLPLKAALTVMEGRQALSEKEFDLYKSEMKIGRNSGDINNDIAIQDNEVSRSHAKIIYRDQKFFIQDQRSTTGTKVNDQRLKPFQDVPLEHGHQITIGPRVKLRFQIIQPNRDSGVTQDPEATIHPGTKDPDETLYTKNTR